MSGITHEWNGTVLTITSDSGTSSADLQGAKGDIGVRGAQGARGRDGSTNITSVNGQIGAVNLSAADVGALPDTTPIPSIDGLASEEFVMSKIAEAQVSGGGGGDVDLSSYYTKTETQALINDATVQTQVLLNGYATNSALTTQISSAKSYADSGDTTLKAYVVAEDNKIRQEITNTETTVKSYTDNALKSHGNHVPTTQTASNKVFLRNDNTWATVTPANIGAAASSHTHTKSQITDFPSSMPASDVYSWAKASSKPSYSASEVGAYPALVSSIANCYYRTVDGATEWINPPMQANTEYRTTERYLGKPVYVKVWDAGYVERGAQSLAHNISGITDAIGIRMINHHEDLTHYSGLQNLTFNHTYVHIELINPCGSVQFILRYTK